ncbi:Hypothetical protein NocV09_00403920 [Nannochloropsis oceanica]
MSREGRRQRQQQQRQRQNYQGDNAGDGVGGGDLGTREEDFWWQPQHQQQLHQQPLQEQQECLLPMQVIDKEVDLDGSAKVSLDKCKAVLGDPPLLPPSSFFPPSFFPLPLTSAGDVIVPSRQEFIGGAGYPDAEEQQQQPQDVDYEEGRWEHPPPPAAAATTALAVATAAVGLAAAPLACRGGGNDASPTANGPPADRLPLAQTEMGLPTEDMMDEGEVPPSLPPSLLPSLLPTPYAPSIPAATVTPPCLEPRSMATTTSCFSPSSTMIPCSSPPSNRPAVLRGVQGGEGGQEGGRAINRPSSPVPPALSISMACIGNIKEETLPVFYRQQLLAFERQEKREAALREKRKVSAVAAAAAAAEVAAAAAGGGGGGGGGEGGGGGGLAKADGWGRNAVSHLRVRTTLDGSDGTWLSPPSMYSFNARRSSPPYNNMRRRAAPSSCCSRSSSKNNKSNSSLSSPPTASSSSSSSSFHHLTPLLYRSTPLNTRGFPGNSLSSPIYSSSYSSVAWPPSPHSLQVVQNLVQQIVHQHLFDLPLIYETSPFDQQQQQQYEGGREGGGKEDVEEEVRMDDGGFYKHRKPLSTDSIDSLGMEEKEREEELAMLWLEEEREEDEGERGKELGEYDNDGVVRALRERRRELLVELALANRREDAERGGNGGGEGGRVW